MYSGVEDVEVEDSVPIRTARGYYDASGAKKEDFDDGARAAVRILDRLEPRLRYGDGGAPLVLSLQSDAAGVAGDVRDVLCVRRLHRWGIGLSCKHNHCAMKHSRLSDTIDFGKRWFGYSCSDKYFREVKLKFRELRDIQENGKRSGCFIKWSELPNKENDYYVPILQSFTDELMRLSEIHNDVPERLVRYLLGRNDFYKIVTDDRHRATRIEAINVNGTLNQGFGEHRPIASAASLRMPTRFHHIGFKESEGKGSQTTVLVVCNEGWGISMRLHNASTNVEPSLKFDAQLISFPTPLLVMLEPWD